MAIAHLQIFGTKKCPDTRTAERFFQERRIPFQLVNLAEKGMGARELQAVASQVGGIEALIDRTGKRYRDRGLLHAAPTGPRIEAALVADPLLLKTPVVRAQRLATVGICPEVWLRWLA